MHSYKTMPNGWLFLFLSLCVLCAGCMKDSYVYGVRANDFAVSNQAPLEVTHGGEHPRLDKVERALEYPREAISRLRGGESLNEEEIEQAREEAVELTQEYLSVNGLNDVKIDVRRYEPGEHWQRIQANENVSPLWKYTGGAISWFRYTVLPNRVLGVDRYDPYSNTLSLNSERPTQALFESAVAKEFLQHKNLGSYAMLQNLPVLPIIHDIKASSDVLTYSEEIQQPELQSDLRIQSYARIGADTAGEILSLTPFGRTAPFYVSPLARVSGGVAGRMTGKVVSKREKDAVPAQPASAVLTAEAVDRGEDSQ
ncbi:MAG: hypothetical protein AB8B50_08800 [Pirellulaceae bacterium]